MFWGHMIANTVLGSSWEGIFTSDLDARNDEFHLMSRIFCCLEVLYVNRADIFHHNLASGHYQAVSSRASLARLLGFVNIHGWFHVTYLDDADCYE